MLTERRHKAHAILETRKERAERYRREAARLRSEAQALHDPELLPQFLDVASQYESLAATTEGLDAC